MLVFQRKQLVVKKTITANNALYRLVLCFSIFPQGRIMYNIYVICIARSWKRLWRIRAFNEQLMDIERKMTVATTTAKLIKVEQQRKRNNVISQIFKLINNILMAPIMSSRTHFIWNMNGTKIYKQQLSCNESNRRIVKLTTFFFVSWLVNSTIPIGHSKVSPAWCKYQPETMITSLIPSSLGATFLSSTNPSQIRRL